MKLWKVEFDTNRNSDPQNEIFLKTFIFSISKKYYLQENNVILRNFLQGENHFYSIYFKNYFKIVGFWIIYSKYLLFSHWMTILFGIWKFGYYFGASVIKMA